MAAPVYVNDTGTSSGNASATTINIPIPGARVSGNLLVAWIRFDNGPNNLPTVNNNWTVLELGRFGRHFVCWRIVDGTETTPTVSWTGAHLFYYGSIQISGNSTVTPIGNYSDVSASDQAMSTSTLTGQVIPTTGANSMILGLLFIDGNAVQAVAPTGWTAGSAPNYSDSNGSTRICYQTKTTAGLYCDTVAQSITASVWGTILIEIPSVQTTTPQIQPGWFTTSFQGQVISGTSSTLAIPAYAQPGNLMIAIALISISSPFVPINWSSPWTVGDTGGSVASGISTSWAFAYNNSLTAPTVTWDGASRSGGIFMVALNRVPTAGPIGAHSSATSSGTGTTTAVGTPITTIRNNSLILGLMANPGNGPTSVLQSNYISLWWQGGSGGGMQLTYQTKLVAGSTSDAFNVAFTPNGGWSVFMIEIPGVVSPLFAHRNYIAKGQAS